MIVVAPLHEVADVMAQRRPSHVITLVSPQGPTAALDHDGPRLRLTFHDIAEPLPDLTPPTRADVERVLAFTRSWDAARPMLIHCWAGVSRSPAVAYIVACDRAPPGEEARLAAELRAAAPFATPNPLLIGLADQVLNRSGAMAAAIGRIGRGAETASGSTFVLAPARSGAGRRIAGR